MQNFKERAKAIIAKLKTIKNIEIIIGVVIICIVVLIYSSVSVASKNNTADADTASNASSTTNNITDGIEQKLEAMLSQINGAGKVKVMVTFETTPEIVAASTTNTHTSSSTSNSTTTETVTPIIVANDIIILKQSMPRVMGVIVVAEGASTVKVRADLQKAVQTILGCELKVIEVFAMK